MALQQDVGIWILSQRHLDLHIDHYIVSGRTLISRADRFRAVYHRDPYLCPIHYGGQLFHDFFGLSNALVMHCKQFAVDRGGELLSLPSVNLLYRSGRTGLGKHCRADL